MSVILFGAEELGNALAYLTSSRYSSERHAAQVAEDLAAYSVGNAFAYNSTYNENAEPVSAAEITRAAKDGNLNRESAKGTLRLLSYNGISNAGEEINLLGYFAAVSRLMSGALARVMDEQEPVEVDPVWTR